MASALSLVDDAGIQFKGSAAEVHQLAKGKELANLPTLYDLRALHYEAH